MDGSEESVEEVLSEVPFLRYVRDTAVRKPVGVCRNLALEHVTGDVIVHIDDDDFYYPTWVSDAVRVTATNPLIGSGSHLVFDLLSGKSLHQNVTQRYYSGATAMAYTRTYANEHAFGVEYTDEEWGFTKGFREPLFQMPFGSTSVCMIHRDNFYHKTRRRPVLPFTLEDLIPDEPSRAFYLGFMPSRTRENNFAI